MNARARFYLRVVNDDGTTVAELDCAWGDAEANAATRTDARLIAAAPEMLEALRGALAPNGHAWNCAPADNETCNATCTRIRAAIAKAGGK